jgi:hypothetical protein
LTHIRDGGERSTNNPLAKEGIGMSKHRRVGDRVKASHRLALFVRNSCRVHRQQHKKDCRLWRKRCGALQHLFE